MITGQLACQANASKANQPINAGDFYVNFQAAHWWAACGPVVTGLYMLYEAVLPALSLLDFMIALYNRAAIRLPCTCT